MEEIFGPKFAKEHPDYALEADEALDLRVQELIDDAVQAGWDTRTVIKALENFAKATAISYDEHSDPEEDATETDSSAPEFGTFPVE